MAQLRLPDGLWSCVSKEMGMDVVEYIRPALSFSVVGPAGDFFKVSVKDQVHPANYYIQCLNLVVS